METVRDFIFLGSKITADGNCGHEIKRCLLFGRKAMTNLDSIFNKQRYYFANKGPSNQSYGFSSGHVWMWELDYKENWVLKNWCFELWSWRRLFNPKGDQSWIFIGRTDVEAETPYFGHLMQRTDSFEKTLMLWKIEGRRRRGWLRMKWLDGITDSMDVNLSWWWIGKPGMLQSMELQRVEHDWVTELNWTECLF